MNDLEELWQISISDRGTLLGRRLECGHENFRVRVISILGSL